MENWKTAQIKDPLSQYTLVLSTAGYVPSNKENYRMIVRATDKTGKIQTTEMRPPFPQWCHWIPYSNRIGMNYQILTVTYPKASLFYRGIR